MMKGEYKELFEAVNGHPLFRGLPEEALREFLSGPFCRVKRYGAAENVFMAGDAVSGLGLVVSGKLRIQREGFGGDVVIVGEIEAGDTFAEAFVCAGAETMPVSVWTVGESEILFVDFAALLSEKRERGDGVHFGIIRNMLRIAARKLLFLSRRIEILSKPTTREKLISYLEEFVKQSGREDFSIPLNRQELADFLAVDRSALSREMGRMEKDGVLEFRKNRFKLIGIGGSP